MFGEPIGRVLKLRDKSGNMKTNVSEKLKNRSSSVDACCIYKKKNQLSDSCKEDCSFKKDVRGLYVPVCEELGYLEVFLE